MKSRCPQNLQPNDFAMALQELQNHSEVSVDALVEIQHTAEKYARFRITESITVDKIMMQPVTTVQPECTLSEAAHILVSKRISGLPVIDQQQKLIGIITEADFLRALGIPAHHPGHSLWQTLENLFNPDTVIREADGKVSDLMIREVITVSPEQTLHEALETMKRQQIKRLVVTDARQHVVGIITRSNLVQLFFDHFQPIQANSPGE